MYPVTRILNLTSTCALVALTATTIFARAENSGQDQAAVDARPTILTDKAAQIGQCHLLRRAISRRACVARLRDAGNVDVAGNQ
jgi:hypothetical protein